MNLDNSSPEQTLSFLDGLSSSFIATVGWKELFFVLFLFCLVFCFVFGFCSRLVT